MLTDCLLTLHSNLNRCTLEGLRCAGKSRGVWQSTRLELSSRAILYSASEPSREASEAVLTQRNKMSGNNNARFLVEGQGWYYWWQFCQSFYLWTIRVRPERWSIFQSDGMVNVFFQATIDFNGFSMVLTTLDHHH